MKEDLKIELSNFYKEFKQNATRMLKTNPKYQYLYQYILKVTPSIINSDDYPLTMKIYWILNDMTNFPVCPICGTTIKHKQYSVFAGFVKTCSYKCSRLLATKSMQETCLDKYGVSNGGGIPSSLEKIRKKHLEHYGVENVYASDWFKDSQKKRNLENYGVEFYSQTQDFLDKCKRTNLKNRGVEYPLQSKESINKMQQTTFNKYGVYNVAQVSWIQKKQHQRYLFDSKSFDSAPEIAFYIYLKDNNMQFEYQPDVSFDYSFNGKVHKYFPDFKVEGRLYEIKGDHFFKDSKMVCPYRDKSWTDEQYLLECSKYEAKHQCMLVNNVIILTSKDYRKYIDYVENAYGKDFLKQFKTQTMDD